MRTNCVQSAQKNIFGLSKTMLCLLLPLIIAKSKVQKILPNSPGSIWPVHSRKLDFRVNVNLFGLKNIGPASLTLACSRVAKALLDLEVIDLALKKLH